MLLEDAETNKTKTTKKAEQDLLPETRAAEKKWLRSCRDQFRLRSSERNADNNILSFPKEDNTGNIKICVFPCLFFFPQSIVTSWK